MSGGFGHIAKMARENKIQTANRKERLKNYKKKIGTYTDSKIELKFKEVSAEKLEIIKLKIQEKFRKERIKNRYQSILIIITILISTYYFVWSINTFIFTGSLIFMVLISIFLNMKNEN